MNMQLHALRQRDLLQQYANLKYCKSLTVFRNFCKFLEHYFILHVREAINKRW